ncbi:MAG: tetrahydrofolate dehydrogenase/cyclohydrolase catalytic domain-containing protein [Acutalibacteraceae bacterium]|nr:tetrahydrofolate dehydrogenase/cyclohydrolase catalytic domain-containing protein [Acutalibacteraceae bacterium]
MSKLLDCKPVAEAVKERCRRETEELRAQGIVPKLAILRVGEKGPDLAYERGATAALTAVGIDVEVAALPADASQESYIAKMVELNCDPAVNGILPFRPLDSIDEQVAITETIDPRKDVDSSTDVNMGKTVLGDPTALTPCTAQAVMEVLDYYKIPLDGQNVTVINRSNVIGKPVSMMLVNRHATVSVCSSHTKDMEKFTKNADILVVAIPKVNAVKAEWIAPGTTVIDCSVIRKDGKTSGCCEPAVYDVAGAITPVPGLGKVTSALLARNVLIAAKAQHGLIK